MEPQISHITQTIGFSEFLVLTVQIKQLLQDIFLAITYEVEKFFFGHSLPTLHNG
ncbi:MAG TPA: hypothetical protein VI461_18405 [Chitinophagaceae bacterium]|nr:hypothetical protein [Chitinophagaceae bacterium]